MTYAITITEPGAEPVSVSLEWTAEAPTVDGSYFVEVNREVCAVVDWLINDGTGKAYIDWLVTGYEFDPPFKPQDVTRWLGPIPLASKGE